MANLTLLVGYQWTQRWVGTSLYYPNQISVLVIVDCAVSQQHLLKIKRHARRVAWREFPIIGPCDHRCRYTHNCHVCIRWLSSCAHVGFGHTNVAMGCCALCGLDIDCVTGIVLCMLICRLDCWCVCVFVTCDRCFDALGCDLLLPSMRCACMFMTQLVVRSYSHR